MINRGTGIVNNQDIGHRTSDVIVTGTNTKYNFLMYFCSKRKKLKVEEKLKKEKMLIQFRSHQSKK